MTRRVFGGEAGLDEDVRLFEKLGCRWDLTSPPTLRKDLCLEDVRLFVMNDAWFGKRSPDEQRHERCDAAGNDGRPSARQGCFNAL